MFMHRLRQGAAALAIATGLLVPAHQVFAAPETLTIALPGDFPSLVPSDDTSPLGFNYRLNVFDQLTVIGKDGKIGPRLATEWTASDDLLKWTFKLRTDALFHDGSPVTAHDVEFTARYILDNPKSPTRTFLRLVDSVKAIDDHTIEFTLNQPYSIFERQISFINVMPKDYHTKVGEEGYAKAPIGSGPYKVVNWVKDDRLELEAFDKYWGGAPEVKKAVFRPIPAEASRATALMSGEVDLVTTLPPALVDTLARNDGIEVKTVPGSRVMFLGFNSNAAPLDNPKIREAIDIAIDREAITQGLLRGLGRATGMMIPPNNVGYNPEFVATKQDMARAKQLVAESGYAGEPILFDYPSNNFVLANEIAQAIAGYLTEAGLKVELRPAEFTAFFPQWTQTAFPSLYMFAYGSTQYHADTILTSMYSTGGRVYRLNPEIDALVAEQKRERDPVKQAEIISRIFKIGAEDRDNVPLYDEFFAVGMKKDLGYEAWPDGFVRLYEFR
ncbi:ABC transporter substrate-binding protein [Phaeovulum sp. NW3]|uniref:ABC transporter substrate-binding protein n=1 Tax=Phaeovulum sp. NW3 TaxID=2934933 RepID=UPI002020539D|nr:ABC transporter substrate-binding protein [Phaeovulum sp. NW3]MCL7466270.1 ABC transporter substrate-binding protein [Phaeovulum sp. NW3]